MMMTMMTLLKNKIKKGENKDEIKERKESNDYNSNYNIKTERESNHIYNIRLPMKKVDINKNDKNIHINNDKPNGLPTLNYIKISNDKRNLISLKNIKKEYTNTEVNNDTIKSKNNNENKSPLKDNKIKKKEKNEVSKEYNRNIRKNKSPLKQITDNNFKPVFKKFEEFFKLNLNKKEKFQKIISAFNEKYKQLNIKENKIINEKMIDKEIEKELELCKFISSELRKIKDDMNNNDYKPNSVDKLLNIMIENEHIKKYKKTKTKKE